MMRLSEQEAAAIGVETEKPCLSAKQIRNKTLLLNAERKDHPQALLFAACQKRWPDCVAEFSGAVPGRKFRLDIAFPNDKLDVEMDGWQYHGKYLSDFKRDRDRERQNPLTLHGWRILRFTRGDVKDRLEYSLGLIQQAKEGGQTDLVWLTKKPLKRVALIKYC